MTRMTGPDCAVMCNLINTHTHTHTCCTKRSIDSVFFVTSAFFVTHTDRIGNRYYERIELLIDGDGEKVRKKTCAVADRGGAVTGQSYP